MITLDAVKVDLADSLIIAICQCNGVWIDSCQRSEDGMILILLGTKEGLANCIFELVEAEERMIVTEVSLF